MVDAPPVVRLSSGEYSALVSSIGAAVRRLQHRGRDLMLDDGGLPSRLPFAGVVLAPWPNRVASGSYRFQGIEHQLPINEVERGNALHGLSLYDEWWVDSLSASAVTMTSTIWPRPGYPFALSLSAHYELRDTGLFAHVTAANRGDGPAPVGLSTHPYLTTGTDTLLDDWTLTLPCAEVCLTDERLIPCAPSDVAAAGVDFRKPRLLSDIVLDHAFTAVEFVAGTAAAQLVDPSGVGVEMRWQQPCGWLQVYTLMSSDPKLHRRAVAIEPMTCAPDAFNNEWGLISLEPGETAAASWSVAGLDSRS